METKNNAESPSLPRSFKTLKHQAAGHIFGENGSQLGVLKHADGSILKTINGDRGENELKFYEMARTHTHLKKLVPEFRGSVVSDYSDSHAKFLRLEDLAENCTLPCVLDVKMGKQTWDPLTASEKKKTKEESKYVGTKVRYGFSIPGMRYYSLEKGTFIVHSKEFGKGLTESDTPQAFKEFLNGAPPSLVQQILSQLDPIVTWFETQTQFHFYASSILIVYDAQALKESWNDGKLDSPELSQPELLKTRVSMIDFAHVNPGEGSIDQNYLFGLHSLQKILQSLR